MLVGCDLDEVTFEMIRVIFRTNETNMKRLLMLLVLVLAGCGDPSGIELSPEEIISQVNSSGTISDEQAESLSKVEVELYLNGLTSITDEQAKSLSKVEYLIISQACQPLIGKYKKPYEPA